jgi:hypothetical protein
MMWRMIISVLLILWLIGFAVDVAGGLIHLLLVYSARPVFHRPLPWQGGETTRSRSH